jgi:peptidoglycan/xylan/chitin deacetylase (PgdA/CDA1 family)
MTANTWKERLDILIRGVLAMTARGARGILINNHAQNAQQILAQVNALAPFVEFIGYDEIKNRLSGKSGGKPFCLLTFDDGKAVNATETAPELLRLGVPAVFYLVTALTGTDRALWFDRLAAVRRAAGSSTLPESASLKLMPWRDRDTWVDQLCENFHIEADVKDPAVRLMTWEDAAQLQRNGFEIGSHTSNHAILTVETPADAHQQIADSIHEMTQRGLRCRSFAFPNGNATRPLVEMALAAGLESTVTTAPVWIRKRDDLGCLPRLYFKERAGPLHMHIKMVAAHTGCALKNPSGEGRRYLFNS